MDAAQLATLSVLATICAAIIEIMKRALKLTGDDASRWMPLLSIIIGAALATFYSKVVPTEGMTIWLSLWQGMLAGLTASGLYSGTKETASILKT